MSDRDPERWLRSTSTENGALKGLLEAGRDEQPSTSQLNALAKRLEPTFSGSGSGGAGGATGAATAGAKLAPLAIGALLVLGVTAAWLGSRGADTHASEAPRRAEPVHAARPAPASPRPEPAPVPVLTPTPQPAPGAPPVVAEETSVAPKPVPRPTRVASEPAQDPVAELALLEEAHRSLTSDPRRTLEVAETHRRRFPRGQYEQEREVLAIEALLGLHERARASARGARFLARHAESSHARRVRALLAESEKPPAAVQGAQQVP